MINTQIIGYLGFDAVKEHPASSDPYLRFSVAVNQKRNGQEMTQWCTVFTRQMNLEQYLKRGTHVFVDGNTHMKPYQAKHGGWEVGVTINAKTIQFLGSSKAAEPTEPVNQTPPPVTEQTNSDSNEDSDDLPF